MTFNKTTLSHIFFMKGKEKLFMGRLALKDHMILFEYDPGFIKTGLELSPFKLPLKTGVMLCKDKVFNGLFGLFNDSLPDGWGRLLMDRALMKHRLNPAMLSPLDRLSYVGHQGMGALLYEPAIKAEGSYAGINLDEIAHEMYQFQEEDNDQWVEDLLLLNGSSAGARPKILLNIEGEEWIIKFRSYLDSKEVGLIEYAYHKMAKEALLEVPEAKLFPSKKGPGYFGVKRFDRVESKRIHMHSLSGLLHVDHQVPMMDYKDILKTTLYLTKDIREVEKQFRVAIFNVISHNRDDHTKNFSFLMNEQGVWKVSPAYDLTFSSGPGGEHCTTLMHEGKAPDLSHMLTLAEVSGIKKKHALQIIDEVKNAVSQWRSIAQEIGITRTSITRIQNSLDSIFKTVST